MAVLSIRCRHPQAGSLCTAIFNDAFKQKNLRVISRPLFRRLTSEKKCRTSKFPKPLRKRWYRPDVSKGRNQRISGLLLPNRNNREASALSLRERVREARVRARIDSIFRKSCPHPAFGHPLPEGEGPRLKMIPVEQQPLRPWPRSSAATRLNVR